MLTSPLAAFHPANLLTYGSLMSGIGAMVAADQGLAAASGALIALAVVADTFDGRFAGLFNRTPFERAVGVQIDSLSDAIVFAAAPCVCVALLAPDGTWVEKLGTWVAFVVFAACAITRLAFYNASRETADDFVGLPVPVAALIWSSVLLVGPSMLLSAAILASAAAAMVAPVRIPRPTGLGLGAFIAWPLVVVAAHLASL